MIHCKISLHLTWSENCVITDIVMRAAGGDNSESRALTDATFITTKAKLYVPVVIPSTLDNNKLLQQWKTGF